MGIENICCLD